jgi:hypothetical protein
MPASFIRARGSVIKILKGKGANPSLPTSAFRGHKSLDLQECGFAIISWRATWARQPPLR